MDVLGRVKGLFRKIQGALDDHIFRDDVEDHDHLLYYGLARALRRGDADSHRPALPTELVIAIFDFLDVKKKILEVTSGSFSVSQGGRMGLQVDVEPLLPIIGRLHLQLTTKSHDQGWVSDRNRGNWTWFDILVQNAKGENKGDEEDLWISHYNKLASREMNELQGPIFGPNHPIWNCLEPGDKIAARANARFGGWVNYVEEMKLEIWGPFDPTRFG